MGISSRMSLRLEQSIEIPERAFHISIGLHLLEAHFSKNFRNLLLSLHQDMQVSILDFSTFGIRIEIFELAVLPGPVCDHCAGDLRFKNCFPFTILLTLLDDKVSLLFLFYQFPFLHFGNLIFQIGSLSIPYFPQQILILIVIQILSPENLPVLEINYLLSLSIAKANLISCSDSLFNLLLGHTLKGSQLENLSLGRALISVLLSLLGQDYFVDLFGL